MHKELTKVSKYLSFVLRHQPEVIGIKLSKDGWADIDELIDKITEFDLNRELLNIVVETNDKQRFGISPDGKYIRANQGHSVNIELGLDVAEPPLVLIHGTADKFWPLIQKQGLVKGLRHHVHLTESKAVAKSVGGRYGKPMLLSVDAKAMASAGFEFFKTANNVWLVDKVPTQYIKVI